MTQVNEALPLEKVHLEYVWLSHAGHPQHLYPYKENPALCGRVNVGPSDINGELRPKCKACTRLGKKKRFARQRG